MLGEGYLAAPAILHGKADPNDLLLTIELSKQ
jgi:hypothetical protein